MNLKTLLLSLSIILPLQLSPAITPDKHVEAKLISEVASIKPGEPFWIGLYLSMEPGWHTYWKNPGETGYATEIDWELPEGFKVSALHWPSPKLYVTDGLVNYAYEGKVLLLTQITPPSDLPTNEPITIKGTANWLACKEQCIPGEEELSLKLSIQDTPPVLDPQWKDIFAETRNSLPKDIERWNTTALIHSTVMGEFLGILIESSQEEDLPKLPESLYFFPEDEDLDLEQEQHLMTLDSGYFLVLKKIDDTLPAHLKGDLVNPHGWLGNGKALSIPVDSKIFPSPFSTVESTVDSNVDAAAPFNFYLALLFAFIGGLILNLMPCVFPVLSIKILSFVNQARKHPWRIKLHGLSFAAGVLASFWILSGLLLLLRAGGEHLGWGFQLQSPFFIIFLSFLLFFLAFNFLGIYEVGTSLVSLGGKLNKHHGYIGSFLSGVLATVLATPCTAPFMGTALGFALAQPTYVALSTFTSLAVGMAFPYLVLSFSPKLLKMLPRPGAWMDHFKQAMAFPLFATVIWLLWIFGKQTNTDALIILLFGFLSFNVSIWIYGRFVEHVSIKKHPWAFSFCLLFLIVGIFLSNKAATAEYTPVGEVSISHAGLEWETFSDEYLQDLRKQGKPIFIDFTAAWCLTCQVNKANIFSSKNVVQALKDKGFVLLKGDWTRKDPAITKALESYNRSGVPTNILYPPHPNSDPIVLPELLTPEKLLNSLKGF